LNNPYLEETFTPKPEPQPSDEEINSVLDGLLNNPYLEETFNNIR
jgi:hypothetical protein